MINMFAGVDGLSYKGNPKGPSIRSVKKHILVEHLLESLNLKYLMIGYLEPSGRDCDPYKHWKSEG